MKAAGPLNLPSVRDEGPVSVRRDTNSPEAAGFMRAAQARASGGEAIARGVQAFAAGIDKMAEDRDRAKALAAYNDYVTKSSELLYNADSGFMNAQGAGAEGLAYRVNEAHNTLRGEVADGLSSRQRRLFMESAASYDRDVARSAMRYEGRAMAEYRRTEGARTLENMAAAFAAAPDDISIETQEESIYSVTMALFGDQGEEANAANVRSVRSDFISKAALLIAERDPLRAEAFVRENAKLMDEAAAEATRIKVEASALPVKARSEAEELLSQYGEDGMTEALAAVREAHAGPEAEDYAKYVKSVFSEAKTAREERRAAIAEGFYGVLNGGGSFAAAQRFIDQNRGTLGEKNYHSYMDLAERLWSVGKYASERTLSRDELVAAQELYNEAKAFAMSETEPTPEEVNERYGAALEAATGSNKLLQSILKLTAPKAGGAEDKRGLYKANDIVRKLAEDAGVLRDAEEYLSFDAEWVDACAAKAKEKGAPLTRQELVEEGEKLLEEKTVLGRTGWFSGGPLTGLEYQFRRLGIRAEDVKWDAAGGEYVVERDGQFYALEEDEDFYELKPLKGSKRNFEERD